MSVLVAVVYHSRSGHTRVLAEAVVRGAESLTGVGTKLIAVDEAESRFAELASADAIVLGCPTFMGSASAPFKAFMDATYRIWMAQAWRDKIAAGFTCSSTPSGDKLSTLSELAVFAAQHGMIWVPLGLLPGYSGESDTNRLGSFLGAMAQATIGLGPDRTPPESDRRTAEHLGRRVAQVAAQFKRGLDPREDRGDGRPRHPTASTWELPPPGRPELPTGIRRANLRELAARPGRFEHHLTVVARIGDAQLELTTASEPLYFAHVNLSDEYAMALPTGDALIDGFPLRTFVTDVRSGADVARIQHRVGDLVLHPYGYSHWPGRLRPPYEPFDFGPGMRRTGLSMVYCACADTKPEEKPLGAPPGREGDVKAYVTSEVPLFLAETRTREAGVLARVGETHLELLVNPSRLDAPRGGYLLVLEAIRDSVHVTCDLLHVPPGGVLPTEGIVRALFFTSSSLDAAPPPGAWDAVPAPPFATFEEGTRGDLPVEVRGLSVEEATPATVRVTFEGKGGEVPRHWLARLLFRIALHGYSMGYVETYGGFYYDDRDGLHRMGMRDAGEIQLSREEIAAVVERLYRAVPPPGYVERPVLSGCAVSSSWASGPALHRTFCWRICPGRPAGSICSSAACGPRSSSRTASGGTRWHISCCSVGRSHRAWCGSKVRRRSSSGRTSGASRR
jgi:NAD(P)H dehydrogenase (quinone)